jgi:hypothetical protein
MLIYRPKDSFCPLLFLSALIYNLLIIEQTAEARCLIKSKSTGLCQECASDYYYPDFFNSSSSSNGPPQFPSALCLKKRSPTESFTKTVYVTNRLCDTPSIFCDYSGLSQTLLMEEQAMQSYLPDWNSQISPNWLSSSNIIRRPSLPWPRNF